MVLLFVQMIFVEVLQICVVIGISVFVGCLQVVLWDGYMVVFVEVDVLDFGLVLVGVDLQDVKVEVEVLKFDLSCFSVVLVGSDMGQVCFELVVLVLDISYLCLQD